MSAENSLPPPMNNQEKWSDEIKTRFVTPVEALVIGGMRYGELEYSIDASFNYPDIEYVLDVTIKTSEQVSRDAGFGDHESPTHEIAYSFEDKAKKTNRGETFSLIGPKLFVISYDMADAVDTMPRHEATEVDFRELAFILDKFKGREPTRRSEF